MKKKYLAMLFLAASLTLSACSVNANKTETTTEVPAETEVAEVTDAEAGPEETEIVDTTDTDLETEDIIGAFMHEQTEEFEGEDVTFTEYLVFQENGMGFWLAQDGVPFTYGDGLIMDGMSDPLSYELDGDELTVQRYKYDAVFTRIDGEWPEDLVSAMEAAESDTSFSEATTDFMPDDFLQEREFISSFMSYEDVLACLEPGEAYTYATFKGYDDEFLIITNDVYEDNGQMVTGSACVYANVNGEVKNVGNFYSMPGYPIKTDGELLFDADEENFEGVCLDKDTAALMVMYSSTKRADSETDVYDTFSREDNTVTDDGEFFEIDADAFNANIDFYNSLEPLTFTVVE